MAQPAGGILRRLIRQEQKAITREKPGSVEVGRRISHLASDIKIGLRLGAMMQSVDPSSRCELLYLIDPVGIERNMPLSRSGNQKNLV